MTSDNKKGLTRRGFIGLAGAAMTTTAAASLLSGCGAQGQSSADNSKVAPSSLSQETGIEAPSSGAPNADGNYNILFITTDQEHYFSDYPEGTHFAARQLLEELGCTFEKHYVCSNMSTSSRAVMYTGSHITENLMRDNVEFPWQLPLKEDITTVGDRMREAGYYTAFKGKFHMGSVGAFEEVPTSGSQQTNALEGYGFSDWNGIGEIAGSPLQGFHYDDFIEGEATQWLREKGLQLNSKGQSFFLAVNFVNPHDIMYFDVTDPGDDSQASGALLGIQRAPKQKTYQETYPKAALPLALGDAIDAPGRIQAHVEYAKGWDKNAGHIQGTTEQWERFRDFYLNCIQDNDDYVLDLLHEVSDLGLLENTIIVMTSDHGEMEGDHGLRGKGGFIYERNIHVPLRVYHPDLPGGTHVNSVTSHIDLAPTFLALTSLEDDMIAQLGSGLRGNSFADKLKAADSETSSSTGNEGQALFAFEMFSMLDGDMSIFYDESGHVTGATLDGDKRGFIRGLITSRYKFARYFSPKTYNLPTSLEELYANNDVELYDLEQDPSEVSNLALDRAAHADLIMELNEQLNSLIAAQIGVDDGASWKEAAQYWKDLSYDAAGI